MIELLCVESVGGFRLRLAFSDGSEGVFDAGDFVRQSGSLLVALREPAYFARCFVESGGLCWPNGLELGPRMLQQMLRDRGQLRDGPRAA